MSGSGSVHVAKIKLKHYVGIMPVLQKHEGSRIMSQAFAIVCTGTILIALSLNYVGSAIVDLLLSVTPICGFCYCSMSHDCCVALPHDTTGLSAVGEFGIT